MSQSGSLGDGIVGLLKKWFWPFSKGEFKKYFLVVFYSKLIDRDLRCRMLCWVTSF